MRDRRLAVLQLSDRITLLDSVPRDVLATYRTPFRRIEDAAQLGPETILVSAILGTESTLPVCTCGASGPSGRTPATSHPSPARRFATRPLSEVSPKSLSMGILSPRRGRFRITCISSLPMDGDWVLCHSARAISVHRRPSRRAPRRRRRNTQHGSHRSITPAACGGSRHSLSQFSISISSPARPWIGVGICCLCLSGPSGSGLRFETSKS
jgi:hypothetical protein